MKARVFVTLKDGILDPQGKAIEGALKSLGVEGIASVRQGKLFEVEVAAEDRTAATGCCAALREIARQPSHREFPGRTPLNAAIILFPGSNREQDAIRAHRHSDRQNRRCIWHGERELPSGIGLVVLPGGFSYGDYLRCGAIAARAAIMEAVRAHAAKGGLVLGICNGFQILLEAACCPAC